MTDYQGPDRRIETEPGKLGRRHYDWHCGEHHLIQETTKNHRQLVCGKIAALHDELKNVVSWKVVVLLVPIAVIVLGSGFGYFAYQIDRNADIQAGSMVRIASTLEEIQQAQVLMKYKINQLDANAVTKVGPCR
jgi:hypothetical protein